MENRTGRLPWKEKYEEDFNLSESELLNTLSQFATTAKRLSPVIPELYQKGSYRH